MPEVRYEKTAACYQFDTELSAYLEGEHRPAVALHAQACSFCRPVLADLQQIRSVAPTLALPELPPNSWAKLRARLVNEGILREPKSAWRRWFEGFGLLPNPIPVTAVACLVILASLLILSPTRVNWREPARSLSNRAKAPVVSAVMDTDEDSNLARAVSEVETNYKAHEASLEPSVQATYQKSLESLNKSIRECRASIHQQPSNTLAREYLLNAYAQKAQVLAAALQFDARRPD